MLINIWGKSRSVSRNSNSEVPEGRACLPVGGRSEACAPSLHEESVFYFVGGSESSVSFSVSRVKLDSF